MKRALFATIFALILCFSGTVAADIIVLDDCRELEGVVEKKSNDFEVSGPFGKIKVPRKRVLKVIEKETPWEKFDRCFKDITLDDSNAFLTLGKWAHKVGLKNQAVRAFEKAIAANQDNKEARDFLGYKKINDKWIKGDELKIAEGYQKIGNNWFTAEEFKKMSSISKEQAKKIREDILSLFEKEDATRIAAGVAKIRELGPNRSRLFFINGALDKKHPFLRKACVTALKDYPVSKTLVNTLLLSTLADGNQEIRAAARETLRDLQIEGIDHTYNRALYSLDKTVRDRALEAVDYYRFQTAIPHLINVIEAHEIHTGTGSGFIEITRVENYIADYEGLIATQAAILDPIVKQYKTGSVLWVSVKVVDILKRITGVDMGHDPAAWRRWRWSYIID